MKKTQVKDKEDFVSASQKRAVASLRRAEKKREDDAKYIVNAYTVRRTDGIYPLPFYCVTDAQAAITLRQFVESAEGKVLLGSDLYRIGTYDVRTGKFTPFKVFCHVTY